MTVFSLKLLALLLMLLDHVYLFFSDILQVPLWFTWAGRLSAPLFFFCMAQGMEHTRNPVRYLLRLYTSSLLMGGGNLLLPALFPGGGELSNNIFSTLFLGALLISLMGLSAADPRWGAGAGALLLFLFFASWTTCACLPPSAGRVVSLLLPTPFSVEGGAMFAALGPLFYFFRNDPRRRAGAYLLFSLCFFTQPLLLALQGTPWQSAFLELSYQWMMVFALPLLLCFDGRPGPSAKSLFYSFYPLHIWAFFLLSRR